MLKQFWTLSRVIQPSSTAFSSLKLSRAFACLIKNGPIHSEGAPNTKASVNQQLNQWMGQFAKKPDHNKSKQGI